MKHSDLGAIAAAAVAASSFGSARAAANLGLHVVLDRPDPIYAVNDRLSMTITASRDAVVEIVMIDAKGHRRQLLPAKGGAKLYVSAGQPAHVPIDGGMLVAPPTGHYELRVTARPDVGVGFKSISHADARLPDRDLREDRSVFFEVEDIGRR